MRSVLKRLARRMMPWTWYPLSSKNRARYEPSWPVTPVISARLLPEDARVSLLEAIGRPDLWDKDKFGYRAAMSW